MEYMKDDDHNTVCAEVRWFGSIMRGWDVMLIMASEFIYFFTISAPFIKQAHNVFEDIWRIHVAWSYTLHKNIGIMWNWKLI